MDPRVAHTMRRASFSQHSACHTFQKFLVPAPTKWGAFPWVQSPWPLARIWPGETAAALPEDTGQWTSDCPCPMLTCVLLPYLDALEDCVRHPGCVQIWSDWLVTKNGGLSPAG